MRKLFVLLALVLCVSTAIVAILASRADVAIAILVSTVIGAILYLAITDHDRLTQLATEFDFRRASVKASAQFHPRSDPLGPVGDKIRKALLQQKSSADVEGLIDQVAERVNADLQLVFALGTGFGSRITQEYLAEHREDTKVSMNGLKTYVRAQSGIIPARQVDIERDESGKIKQILATTDSGGIYVVSYREFGFFLDDAPKILPIIVKDS